MLAASTDVLALVTARLADLRTPSDPADTIEPYDAYLLERSLCKAAFLKAAEEEDARRLEAAYLATMRRSLLDERALTVGRKRATTAPPTPPWTQREAASRVGQRKTYRFKGACCRRSYGSQAHAAMATPTASAESPDARQPFAGRSDLPELSAWARAAAEQEEARNPAKRLRCEPSVLARELGMCLTLC
jgi:hypothetical protein